MKLIKIDAEGWDTRVLEGARSTFLFKKKFLKALGPLPFLKKVLEGARSTLLMKTTYRAQDYTGRLAVLMIMMEAIL